MSGERSKIETLHTDNHDQDQAINSADRDRELAQAKLLVTRSLIAQSPKLYYFSMIFAGLSLFMSYILVQPVLGLLAMGVFCYAAYCELRLGIDRELFAAFAGPFAREEFVFFDEALTVIQQSSANTKTGTGPTTSLQASRTLDSRLQGTMAWFRAGVKTAIFLGLQFSGSFLFHCLSVN